MRDRRRRGSTTFEAALVLPFYVAALLASVQLGLVGLQRAKLRLAAQQAVRAVVSAPDDADARAVATAALARRLGPGVGRVVRLEGRSVVRLVVTRELPLLLTRRAGHFGASSGTSPVRGSGPLSSATLRIRTEVVHARPWILEGPR